MEALRLQDVSAALNISLDEVLEFVSLGYLPPMSGIEAGAYRFREREIRVFAEKFLGYTVGDIDTALQRVLKRQNKSDKKKAELVRPDQITTISSDELAKGGIVSFKAHEEHLQKLSNENKAIFTQYSNYREQVGYRIGQLETMLEQEQAQKQMQIKDSRLKEEKIEILKKKLILARKELEQTRAKIEQRNSSWWKAAFKKKYI